MNKQLPREVRRVEIGETKWAEGERETERERE